MQKLKHNEILEVRHSIESYKNAEKHPVKLLLHNIRSLYNVGSLFRTADSAKLNELILCGYTPYPPRKEIEKTALGAVETVDWRYFKDVFDAVKNIRAEGFKVAALEICSKSRPYNSLRAEDFPLCIIAGNELTGIDDKLLEACDFALEIPMYGVKHSLNVSVAAGISVYAAVEAYNSKF
ncbi:MAG: RNA methyltransferase [Candidatus Kapabacteria bacterium]|nr:RNA methyltransferase [Ignavibacteriota bacterium]MCW5884195.1 RNA methyltransferase [Candidatus Kapabacteria bacterium]